MLAFTYSLTGASLVAAGVAATGALLALTLLPNRPRVQEAEAPPPPGIGPEPAADLAGIHQSGSPATIPGAAQNGETGAGRPLPS